MPGEIEREWQSLCLTCLRDISEQDYIDMRRAFYSGASALFRLLMNHLDAGDKVTEADVQRLRALHEELKRFNDAVKAGDA